MLEQAAAAVLAGGAGVRLGGVRKAFLCVEGRPIVEHQLATLRSLFPEVFVVANEPELFDGLGVRVVPDLIQGRGAPGGVLTAIQAASAPWVFCVACDMPFLAAEPIHLLAGHRGSADAVAPVRLGRPEPLFAFYSKRCLPTFERLLREGSPSLIRLLLSVETSLVDEQELRRADPGLRSLENLNTPEDLLRLGGREAQAGTISRPLRCSGNEDAAMSLNETVSIEKAREALEREGIGRDRLLCPRLVDRIGLWGYVVSFRKARDEEPCTARVRIGPETSIAWVSETVPHDPQEDDPRLNGAFLAADRLALERGGSDRRAIWAEQKRLLKERYDIDWRSPDELGNG